MQFEYQFTMQSINMHLLKYVTSKKHSYCAKIAFFLLKCIFSFAKTRIIKSQKVRALIIFIIMIAIVSLPILINNNSVTKNKSKEQNVFKTDHQSSKNLRIHAYLNTNKQNTERLKMSSALLLSLQVECPINLFNEEKTRKCSHRQTLP